jgi:hypothetical protein
MRGNELISATEAQDVMPSQLDSNLALAAPGIGVGNWTGAPSAAQMIDGTVLLAARIRTADSRGGHVNIYSSGSGVIFDDEPIYTVGKDEVNAESLERPCLIQTRQGKWRLYLSCATPGTKHWRVEMLEADSPDKFKLSSRIVVMEMGLDEFGLKDPVITQVDDNSWSAFVTAHPLKDPNETDKMDTWFGTSQDGIQWQWRDNPVLTPEPSDPDPYRRNDQKWFSRGMRATTMQHLRLPGRQPLCAAMFDGRPDAESNFEEGTGLAVGLSFDQLSVVNSVRQVRSRYNNGALRYAAFLELANGQDLLYYEVANETGAHELRVESRNFI